MSAPTLQSSETSIVALGSFNPMIFQPAWLISEGLMPLEEAEASEIVVTPDFARLTFPWVVVQVLPDRFEVKSGEDLSEPSQLRDLVQGIFLVLQHTPVNRLGLNFTSHYRLPGEDAWHAIGHKLAPKDLWEPVLSKPGTLTVQIQGVVDGPPRGQRNVTVQPSRLVHPGLFMTVNDDRPIEVSDDPPGATLSSVLGQVWDESRESAMAIMSRVLEHVPR
jgi:hypothetical protein